MKIGYMRVSTEEQDTAMQKHALEKYGCDRIFQDKMSGKTTSRPGLDNALAALSAGDSLVVWKLDRLGRRSAALITLLDDLNQKGIGFISLTEGLDTTTPMGEAMAGILAVFAQLERKTIGQRVKAGMAAAKRAGKKMGRSKAPPHPQEKEILALLVNHSIREVAEKTGVNRGKVLRISQEHAAGNFI